MNPRSASGLAKTSSPTIECAVDAVVAPKAAIGIAIDPDAGDVTVAPTSCRALCISSCWQRSSSLRLGAHEGRRTLRHAGVAFPTCVR
jgi:hypothetical protein